jgi:hypothetical protein
MSRVISNTSNGHFVFLNHVLCFLCFKMWEECTASIFRFTELVQVDMKRRSLLKTTAAETWKFSNVTLFVCLFVFQLSSYIDIFSFLLAPKYCSIPISCDFHFLALSVSGYHRVRTLNMSQLLSNELRTLTSLRTEKSGRLSCTRLRKFCLTKMRGIY